jgi:hypothetical protein
VISVPIETISAFIGASGLTGPAGGGIAEAMKPSYALVLALLTAAGAAGQAPKPDAGLPLVLLLDDFKIVDGIVEHANGEYVVRRGKEVRRVPEKRVLFAGESLTAVRQFMVSRAANSPANAAAWQRQFNQTVQPVLSNTCTNCHARPDHPGGFKLTPVSDRYADADGMRANAAAAAAFVNRDAPGASPLLVKAVTAHGGQREPGIRGREHPAYRNLERWVLVSAPPAKPQAARPVDPFDPTEFNRTAHPGR